jgi:hypothetical protein|nr:MAG TPA_asm: hypothetical protein [Caudoviricetes sp.]
MWHFPAKFHAGIVPAQHNQPINMYSLIAFNEVSANFTACFGISISPYFDRTGSNKSGLLQFITHKFVRYLVRDFGYERTDSLESFVCQRYGKPAWTLLCRLKQ